jgi:hypothetical protein
MDLLLEQETNLVLDISEKIAYTENYAIEWVEMWNTKIIHWIETTLPADFEIKKYKYEDCGIVLV